MPNISFIKLSGKLLASVYYKQYFCLVKELDLSDNRLTCIDGLLPYLVNCEMLKLDDNLITELKYLCKRITLGGKKLKLLSLKRNPICQNESLKKQIKEAQLGEVVQF